MSVVVDPGGDVARQGANAPVGVLDSRDPANWAPNEHINKRSSIPFIALHFLPLLAFVTGVTWTAVWLAIGAVFHPDARDHRRVSPLLLAPQLPPQAVPAVRARVRRHDRRAEGPALVGGAPPRAPQVRRHRTRHPLADPRVLVEPRRLDPLRQVQRAPTPTRSRTSRSTPSSSGSTSTTGSVRGLSASCAS